MAFCKTFETLLMSHAYRDLSFIDFAGIELEDAFRFSLFRTVSANNIINSTLECYTSYNNEFSYRCNQINKVNRHTTFH